MKQKLTLFLTTILLSAVLYGCGGAKETPAAQPQEAAESSEETAEPAEEASADAEEDTAAQIEAALTEGRDYFYARNGKDVDNEKARTAFQTASGKTRRKNGWRR